MAFGEKQIISGEITLETIFGSSQVFTPGPPYTFLNDVHRIRRGRGWKLDLSRIFIRLPALYIENIVVWNAQIASDSFGQNVPIPMRRVK